MERQQLRTAFRTWTNTETSCFLLKQISQSLSRAGFYSFCTLVKFVQQCLGKPHYLESSKQLTKRKMGKCRLPRPLAPSLNLSATLCLRIRAAESHRPKNLPLEQVYAINTVLPAQFKSILPVIFRNNANFWTAQFFSTGKKFCISPNYAAVSKQSSSKRTKRLVVWWRHLSNEKKSGLQLSITLLKLILFGSSVVLHL